MQRCSQALASALPALVQLEIDVLLRERGATRRPPELVAIRCDTDGVFLSVTMVPTRRESKLDLARLEPEHRARAIALATAELVDAISPRESSGGTTGSAATATSTALTPSAETATRNRAAPSARVASAALEDRAPAAERSRSGVRPGPTLGAGPLVDWMGAPKTWLLGARVSLSYPLDRVIAPALSFDGALGDSSVAAARVRVETLGAGAHVYFGVASSSVRWQVGPGARLGWTRLAGQPDAEAPLEGRSLRAGWGGPELRARVATAPAPPGSLALALALELGGGYVVLPVRGLVDGSRSVFALEGVWLSASAQIGLAL